MLVIADENIDFKIVQKLRESNFEVLSILESHSGISDKQVIEIANQNKSWIITEDKDFGELAYRLKLSHYGVFLIRLNDMPRKERINLSLKTFIKHHQEILGKFSVLTQNGLRIRKL
jgi:predicted nuclease of predicted toxin-antitoxin system